MFGRDGGGGAGNVQVALQNSEVGVAAEDEFDLVTGDPFEFGAQPVLAKLENLALGRRTPIAKGAGERAAPVGLPKDQPFLISDIRHQLVEQAGGVGRWNHV